MAETNSSAVGGVDKIAHPRVRGVDILRDPLLNKVCGFIFFIFIFKVRHMFIAENQMFSKSTCRPIEIKIADHGI